MFSKLGFSLLELLITITLVVILATLAVPSWHDLYLHNRAQIAADHWVEELNLAKTLAISRGERLRFCKSINGMHCGGEKVNWQDGQIIVEPKTNKIVQHFKALQKGDEMSWHASLTRQDFLDFMPDGSTNGIQGSFIYWPEKGRNPHGKYVYKISTNFNGIIQIKK